MRYSSVASITFALAVAGVLAASRAGADSDAPRSSASASGAGPSATPPFTVVLLLLDGVRSREIFVGPERRRAPGLSAERMPPSERLVPNIQALATTEGAAIGVPGHGRPMRADGPRFISLPGYIQALTGRSTSCTHNGCASVARHTLADDVAKLEGLSPGDIAVFTSWPKVGALVNPSLPNVAISAGRHSRRTEGPLRKNALVSKALDDGRKARPYPGHDYYRPDRFTGEAAVRWLEAKRPALLVLSLGDADERGHRRDYPGYLSALRESDAIIGRVATVLKRIEQSGRKTLLLVTTDHGRSPNFADHDRDRESGDVWLVAAGSAVQARGTLEPRSEWRLRDVVPTARVWLGLPADTAKNAGHPITEILGGEPPQKLSSKEEH